MTQLVMDASTFFVNSCTRSSASIFGGIYISPTTRGSARQPCSTPVDRIVSAPDLRPGDRQGGGRPLDAHAGHMFAAGVPWSMP